MRKTGAEHRPPGPTVWGEVREKAQTEMTGVGGDARRRGNGKCSKKVEKDGEMGQFNQGGQGGPHRRGDVSRTE